MGAIADHLARRREVLAVLALVLILPLVLPAWFAGEDLLRLIIGAAIIGALAVAFDFTAGYINIINFGFAAFSGTGGYTSALVAIHLGISPWLSLLFGLLGAAMLGFFTGLLTLRFRGMYAAVVAWFLALALMGVVQNLPEITRGARGLQVPHLLSSSSNLPYFYLAVALLLFTYLALKLVTESHAGLAFRALGQNMEAARASGVNPARYRIMNFTLSCGFAGLIGAFSAHYIGILTPNIMDTWHTVEILVVAYLGGRGTLWGPAVVAFPLALVTEFLRTNFSEYPGVHLVIYGVLLIVVTIRYPGGFAELWRTVHARYRRLRGSPAGEAERQPAT
jgi:branched-chain amino acid transport system permease protein